VSISYAGYLALLVALALTELWLLRAIVQEFGRQFHSRRVYVGRQEATIARRLQSVGSTEGVSCIEHASTASDAGPDQPTSKSSFQDRDDPLHAIAAE